MRPHAILRGFKDARIARFEFDQPTEGGMARVTFVLTTPYLCSLTHCFQRLLIYCRSLRSEGRF